MFSLSQVFKKPKLKPLYVRRDVLNAPDIIEWAKSVGFDKCVPPDEMHVTIVFSKKPMDRTLLSPKTNTLRIIPEGDRRKITELGDEGAVVLKFQSPALQQRWQDFLKVGASWDYEGYQPHLTLTYHNPPDIDLKKIKPYDGIIILGPELYQALDEDWADKLVEKKAKPPKFNPLTNQKDNFLLESATDERTDAQVDGYKDIFKSHDVSDEKRDDRGRWASMHVGFNDDGTVTMLHGTSTINAKAIKEHGFRPSNPAALATALEMEYNLPKGSIAKHQAYSFAMGRSDLDRVHFTSNVDTATSYTVPEQLLDALTAVYWIQHPDISHKTMAEVKPAWDAWVKKESERLAQPEILAVTMPWDAVGKHAFGREIGLEEYKKIDSDLPYSAAIPISALKDAKITGSFHPVRKHDVSGEPRDEKGKWTTHGIKGLPEDADLSHPSLESVRTAVGRGVFNLTATKEEYGYSPGATTYALNILPKEIPADWKQTKRGKYYDPKYMAETEYGGTTAINQDPSTGEPWNQPEGKEEGYIFRGMSYEEYQHLRKTGQIATLGDYNLGDEQAGLTYYSTDKGQAAHYASGFAPWQYQATISSPAVMIKIKDPGNHVNVAGTGETEVGIRGPLKSSDIEGVYFGHPISIDPGYLQLIPKEYGSKTYTEGSRSSMGVSLRWDQNDVVKKFNAYHGDDGKFASYSVLPLKRDLPRQAEWLNHKAVGLGYSSADELSKLNPEVFMGLAQEWRKDHTLEPEQKPGTVKVYPSGRYHDAKQKEHWLDHKARQHEYLSGRDMQENDPHLYHKLYSQYPHLQSIANSQKRDVAGEARDEHGQWVKGSSGDVIKGLTARFPNISIKVVPAVDGVRGEGGRYFPDQRLVQVTPLASANTIAHEFGHAVVGDLYAQKGGAFAKQLGDAVRAVVGGKFSDPVDPWARLPARVVNAAKNVIWGSHTDIWNEFLAEAFARSYSGKTDRLTAAVAGVLTSLEQGSKTQKAAVEKGDKEGHDFHGNQYTHEVGQIWQAEVAGGKRIFGRILNIDKDTGRVRLRRLSPDGSEYEGKGPERDKNGTIIHRIHVSLCHLDDLTKQYEKDNFYGELVPHGTAKIPVKKAAVEMVGDTHLMPFVSFKDKMRDHTMNQMQLIASLHTSRLSNYGFTAEAKALGVTEYQVNEQLDSRGCKFCAMMNGKRFKVSDANDLLKDIFNVQSQDDMRTVQPWPKQDKRSIAAYAEMSSEELIAHHLQIPPYHPRCLIGVSEITSSSRITAASKRWFEGDVLTLTTARNKKITVTPNHPILGISGWKAAELFTVGDNVVCCVGSDWSKVTSPDNQNMPPMIEEIFDTFLKSSGMSPKKMPTTPIDFHGDFSNSDVEIVSANGDLSIKGNSFSLQSLVDSLFQRAGIFFGKVLGFSYFSPFTIWNNSSFSRVMGGFCLKESFEGGHSGPFQQFSFSPTTDGNIEGLKSISDTKSRYTESAAKLLQGHSGVIGFDKVISVDRVVFSGHVYNLETEEGWFASDSILTHNCRGLLVQVGKVPRIEDTPSFLAAMGKEQPLENIITQLPDTQSNTLGTDIERAAILSAYATIKTRYLTNPVEHGMGLDSEGNTVLEKSGTLNHIDLNAKEMEYLEQGTFIHNHPNNFSLSMTDLTLAAERHLQQIIAIGTDGSEFVAFDVVSASTHKATEQYMLALEAGANLVLSKYLFPETFAGTITEKEANIFYTHMINVMLDDYNVMVYRAKLGSETGPAIAKVTALMESKVGMKNLENEMVSEVKKLTRGKDYGDLPFA